MLYNNPNYIPAVDKKDRINFYFYHVIIYYIVFFEKYVDYEHIS